MICIIWIWIILNVVVSHPIVDVLYTPYLDDSVCFYVIQKFVLYHPFLDDYVFLLIMCSHSFGVGIKCISNQMRQGSGRDAWGTHSSAVLQTHSTPNAHSICLERKSGGQAFWQPSIWDVCSFSSALYLVSPCHFGRHVKKLRGSTVQWKIQVWCGKTSLKRHMY